MQGYLKELRYPITGLAILLLVTVMVLVQRRELRRTVERMETLAVANLLMDAQPADVRFRGPLELPDDNQDYIPSMLKKEDEAYFDAYDKSKDEFGKFGAVEVLGQLGCRDPRSGKVRLHLPAVGELFVSTGRAEDPRFKDQMKSLRALQDAWQEFKDEGEYYRRESEPREKAGDDGAKSLGVQADAAPGDSVASTPKEPERQLYFWEFTVTEKSATIAPGAKFVFTNVHRVEFAKYWGGTRGVPGALLVHYWDQQKRDWSEPLDAGALRDIGAREARRLGITATDLQAAYLELRSMYERQEINLPLLDLNVSAASFLLFALAFSISLAAWASFLLRTARTHPSEREDEPWIMIEPFRRLHATKGWDRPVALIEAFMFGAFHVVAMTTPVVLGVMVVLESPWPWRWGAMALLLFAIALSGAMLRSYALVLRHARRREAAEPASATSSA